MFSNKDPVVQRVPELLALSVKNAPLGWSLIVLKSKQNYNFFLNS